MRSIALSAAVATALAVVAWPGSTSAAEPLTWSTDYALTAQRMAQEGHADLAAGRTFLAFDGGGDGRAVEVLGDLSTADRIVVLVPGSDTTVADFDRGLGGVTRRAPAVQARAVHDAIDSPQVAVIAWLGYDPPEGPGPAAVRQDRARAGAAELLRFLGFLPPHATIVVVGHSYGSVVVSLAAPDFGPRVTDIVALASPGLGADRVTDLTAHARVWLGTASADWINRIPHLRIAGLGHGALPADADRLPTTGVDSHDSYLTPGSSTLEALAALALELTPREST